MKKQILILFLAVFALGATQAYAQAELPYLPPTPIDVNCIDLDNPLTPVPGRPYTYQVDVPTPEGTKTYHWVVTQDQTFIDEGVFDVTVEGFGGRFLATGSVHYDDGENTLDNISLTWQTFALAENEFVFVVIYVENQAPDDGCLTNNLKVYRIQPLHAFTLTMANIDGNVIDTGVTEICVDDVQSAVFDPDYDDGNGGVVYDYGQNEFYFAVAAANFSGDFRLAGTFTGLQAATPGGVIAQTATLYWDYTLAGLDADPNGVAITDVETILGEISPPANESFGEGQDAGDVDAAFMIYIKVVVEHNQFEATTPAGYEYTLALDAVLANPDGSFGAHDNDNELGDLNQDTCEREIFHNETTQLLLPRPTVESVPEGLLLPNAP